MRASAIMLRLMRNLRPRTRAGCVIAAAMLSALLITSTDARAENAGTAAVEGDALAQMAMGALSQGVTARGSWEQRATLVGLGVAGLYLGASTRPIVRDRPGSALRRMAYRLVLPAVGAALGSLVACHGAVDDQDAAAAPVAGAMTGALLARVLVTHARRQSSSGDGLAVAWAPALSVGPGSYSVGVMGRF